MELNLLKAGFRLERVVMRVIAKILVLLCVVIVAGCVTPPTTGYVPVDEAGVMTVGLDDHDYDLVVQSVAAAMMEEGLPEGYVVALGPVDTRDCKYDVQVRTLQKSMMVVFAKEKTLKFTAAVDAMTGNPAAAEIYKLIEYNWFNENPVDTEDMQKFGKLANINGILFGRVSALERTIEGPRKRTEITYRFVWEMADTQTGVIQLTHEKKIRKNVQ